MSSTYGENIKLTIFGESHGPFIGMTLEGIPAGMKVDLEELQLFMNRRAPGQNEFSTPRRELDIPEFSSGIENGYTNGDTIHAIIRNANVRSGDYEALRDCPRPGHADYTAYVKYGGKANMSGGGQFSGRLTAPLCIAGGLCKQWLAERNIRIAAHIVAIGGVVDEPVYLDWLNPDFNSIDKTFPVLNREAGQKMREKISQARADGDSVGGLIECIVTGIPAGIGGPLFDGMESRIAQIIYGIPAVKGLDFGSGFSGSYMLGSENNDAFTIQDGRVVTITNNAGGILGGITNGMPLVFQTAIKPTPSIAKQQKSISLSTMEEKVLEIKGRHDPCIVPRAVPVIEAAAAVAIYDALLMR